MRRSTSQGGSLRSSGGSGSRGGFGFTEQLVSAFTDGGPVSPASALAGGRAGGLGLGGKPVATLILFCLFGWAAGWLLFSTYLFAEAPHRTKAGDLTMAADTTDLVREANFMRHEMQRMQKEIEELRGRRGRAGGSKPAALPSSSSGTSTYQDPEEGGGGDPEVAFVDPIGVVAASGGEAQQLDRDLGEDPTPRAGAVHVMVTSNGNRYMNWQTRIFYQTYLRVLGMPGGDVFAAFTRVLHRTSHDELSTEVPTMRFDPEHPECDVYCPYPVKDRSAAILKWLYSRDAKRAEFVFVAETDYLFVQPIKVPDLPPKRAVGYPFAYIVPEHNEFKGIMARYYDGPPTDIPHTGNAPVLARVEEYKELVPVWVDTVHRIDKDEEALEKLAWIREMYAYSIAAANTGLVHDLPKPPESPLMCQPGVPNEDDDIGVATLLHYTWGTTLVDSDHNEIWKFEKREYANGWNANEPKVPRLDLLPPFPDYQEGMLRAEDNSTVTEARHRTLRAMHDAVNAAVSKLNGENDGVPAGFGSWEEAAQATEPTDHARAAHEEMEAAMKRVREEKELEAGGDGGGRRRLRGGASAAGAGGRGRAVASAGEGTGPRGGHAHHDGIAPGEESYVYYGGTSTSGGATASDTPIPVV